MHSFAFDVKRMHRGLSVICYPKMGMRMRESIQKSKFDLNQRQANNMIINCV